MLKLTQKELKDLFKDGRTYVFHYKTRYEVEHKPKRYVLVKTGRVNYGLPYTEKGTFAAFTSQEAMGFVYVGSVEDVVADAADVAEFEAGTMGLIIKHHKNTTI